MASNGKHRNQNQLQSGHGSLTGIRRHQDMGNLSMLNAAVNMPPNAAMNMPNSAMNMPNSAMNMPNAIPLSSNYLQSSYNCGYPPLPARRNPVSSYGRMGMGMGMGNYYNPYSRYSSNMYTPGYGGYRMSSYGQYGGGPPESSSFIQMAEESTRPAFESIESVVEVVSSISMMLESTYHAVHSSYSAILGVVDQFSRLKDHLAQMLSILALLRGLRWLCLKVLYLMKLRKENPSDEAAWNSAEMAAGLSYLPPRPDKAHGSAWPFLMFVGLVIGAPWLMFKLLSKTVTKKPLDMRAFKDENGRHLVATTAFDFKATQSDELSFSAGERLYLSPSSYRSCAKGWMYACNLKQETGLIPVNYLVAHQKHSTQCTRNAPQSFQQRPNENPAAQGRETFSHMANGAEKFNEAFDYSKNSVENTDTQPSNDNLNNGDEKFNSQPDTRGSSHDPAEKINPQLDTRDYSQNSAENFNTQPGGFDDSQKSTEEIIPQPNDKADEEVAKNQNMDITET